MNFEKVIDIRGNGRLKIGYCYCYYILVIILLKENLKMRKRVNLIKRYWRTHLG